MCPRKLSETKHQSILEAAAAEFRLRGFQGTSMDRIAGHAGVSKRTVYNHFPSKDELFAAIVDDIWSQAEAATHRPFQADRPLEDQLREIARAEIEFLAQDGLLDLARALLATAIQDPEIGGSKLREMDQRDLGIVTWVRDAIAAGALRDCEPEIAGQQFHSLIKGFAFWPQIMVCRDVLSDEEAARVIEAAVEVFLAAYAKVSLVS